MRISPAILGADPAMDVPLADMSNLLIAWVNSTATLVMGIQVHKFVGRRLFVMITREYLF